MINTKISAALAAAVLLSATPPMLAAQDAQDAVLLDGFWIGGGVGIGFGGVSCPACSAGREDALSASVRLGTTFGRRMLVGFEVDGWARTEEEFRFRMAALSAVLFFYPSSRASGTWYIKTGIGAVAYEVSAVDEVPITARGASGQFEIGRGRHDHAVVAAEFEQRAAEALGDAGADDPAHGKQRGEGGARVRRVGTGVDPPACGSRG